MPVEEEFGVDQNYFDQPIDVQSETDDELIQFDDFHNPNRPNDGTFNEEDTSDTGAEINFEDEEEDAPSDDKSKEASAADVDFEDDEVSSESEKDVFKEEEAVEALKKLGYDVKKEGTTPAPDFRRIEIEKIETVVSNLESFIAKPDMELCIQRVTEDLKAEYTKQNRVSEIGGEEYELELKNQLEEYEYNPRMVKLEANTIRNDIQNFIGQKEKERTDLQSELDEEQKKETQKNRKELQTTLTEYANKKMFGQTVSPDVVKSAYKKITSGDFANTINSDKKIQAEVAIFLELYDKVDKSGSATFGEGVAAVVEAINGQGKPMTKTSLSKTVSRPGAGNSIIDRIANWSKRSEVDKKS